MKNQMMVFLTSIEATPQWGKNALVSFSQNGVTIHLDEHALEPLVDIQKAARKIAGQGIKHVILEGEHWNLELIWAYHQGFRDPKGKNSIDYPMLSSVDHNELQARIKISRWVCMVTNASAEEIMPSQFAARVVEFITEITDEEKISVRVIKGKDLLEEKWNGLYTVGRGSKRSPTMLQLDYNPTGDINAPVFAVLVGKGITFDSGGYSLKPSNMMETMRTDMGGAAIITGALALAILRGLNKRIKLVLCCAENMISDRSVKLGDIIEYKNGKTVEVLNTDAEGRLVLADGLIYADEQKPQLIIDCATLTGAAKNALGNDYHALFSFDQELANRTLAIANREHEGLWQLPLAATHRGMLSSDFADLSNCSSGAYMPGASTAAAFLSYFVIDYKNNWLHIDCSAAYRKTASSLWQVGATATGIRTIAGLLMDETILE